MATDRPTGATARAEGPSHAAETDDERGLDELVAALLALRTPDECRRFLRDLCTRGELEALAHRWGIARLLDRGLPYHEVAARAHASTTTVTRVAQWLHHGTGGYRLVLDRTEPSPPAG